MSIKAILIVAALAAVAITPLANSQAACTVRDSQAVHTYNVFSSVGVATSQGQTGGGIGVVYSANNVPCDQVGSDGENEAGIAAAQMPLTYGPGAGCTFQQDDANAAVGGGAVTVGHHTNNFVATNVGGVDITRLDEARLAEMRRSHLGVVFQQYNLIPSLTVADNISLPLRLAGARIDPDTVVVHPSERGHLKQMLLKVGWPAEDLAGYVDGESHPIELVQDGWTLRDYQAQAVDGFWDGGSGVVVLPCGAGKTLVGAAAMARAGATTLILVTNTVSGRQWKRELVARSDARD